MKHGNSVHPHIAENSPTKNMPTPKATGATLRTSEPKGKSTTRKKAYGRAKGNRHR